MNRHRIKQILVIAAAWIMAVLMLYLVYLKLRYLLKIQ